MRLLRSQAETRQPGQDRQDRTAGKRLLGKDSEFKRAGAGQPGQDSRARPQPGQDSQDRATRRVE